MPEPDRAAPARQRPPRTWLRRLLWVLFGLWWVFAAIVVGRAWLMRTMHHRTQEILAAGGTPPARPAAADSSREKVASGTDGQNRPRSGTPAHTLPLIGPVLAGDPAAYEALHREVKELTALANTLMKSRQDGLLSFKSILAQLGVTGAETLSEEEAAAEFIRRAARFDDLLGRWKEALALGPWDFGDVDLWKPQAPEPVMIFLLGLARVSQSMWAALAEASWVTHDSEAAWRHWQAMGQNAERVGDYGTLLNTLAQAGLRKQSAETLRVGLQRGGWSDEQLAALPIDLGRTRVFDDARRGLEGEKRQQENWMRGLGTPGNPLSSALVSPFNSTATNLKNELAISLTTRQQVDDNVAVMHHALDRPLSHFDPATGILLTALPDRPASSVKPSGSPSWFEKFYFMYAGDPSSRSVADDVLPHTIVRTQTTVDQARLAAALEWQHRRDGRYPATLEAVTGLFPDGLPLDPATGESYRYQPDVEGSYRLWGRGTDQADNAGDVIKDLVWAGGAGARWPGP